MILTLITPPTGEPVTLAELKTALKLGPEVSDEDALLNSLITVAREQAEAYLNKQVRVATYQAEYTSFSSYIILPKQPAYEVVSVGYLLNSTDTIDTALATDKYQFHSGHIHYPNYLDYSTTRVRVQFKAGYLPGSDGLESIKTWIKYRAADLYDNPQNLDKALSLTGLLQTEKNYA